MDNLEVRCELQRDAADLPDADIRDIVKQLQHHIKTLIGVSTKITVMQPDGIPRTLTGKAVRILDQRAKER